MTSKFLLDTNVLSEQRRPRPDVAVSSFLRSTPHEQLFTSAVVLAELRRGIELSRDAEVRRALEHWLDDSVRASFPGRILAVTEDVLVRWIELHRSLRRTGRTLADPDALIAATALASGATLVTRNTRDFADLGVPLLNPWTLPA